MPHRSDARSSSPRRSRKSLRANLEVLENRRLLSGHGAGHGDGGDGQSGDDTSSVAPAVIVTVGPSATLSDTTVTDPTLGGVVVDTSGDSGGTSGGEAQNGIAS